MSRSRIVIVRQLWCSSMNGEVAKFPRSQGCCSQSRREEQLMNTQSRYDLKLESRMAVSNSDVGTQPWVRHNQLGLTGQWKGRKKEYDGNRTRADSHCLKFNFHFSAFREILRALSRVSSRAFSRGRQLWSFRSVTPFSIEVSSSLQYSRSIDLSRSLLVINFDWLRRLNIVLLCRLSSEVYTLN